MFIEESLWIKSALEKLDLPAGSKVLDVGSSNEGFRKIRKPHIDKNVFLPLRERGLDVKHLDMNESDGVDIVCDFDKCDPVKFIGYRFDLVICGNMLEHVSDRKKMGKKILDLVKDKGYLLVTVPNVYGYHPDPIDTGYRPSPKELEGLFASLEPGISIISSGVSSLVITGSSCISPSSSLRASLDREVFLLRVSRSVSSLWVIHSRGGA